MLASCWGKRSGRYEILGSIDNWRYQYGLAKIKEHLKNGLLIWLRSSEAVKILKYDAFSLPPSPKYAFVVTKKQVLSYC
jgi:hypothetical protein